METMMKKIFIALSLAVFAMTSTTPAFSASHVQAKMKECKPAKKGFHMDANGKCVKNAAMKDKMKK